MRVPEICSAATATIITRTLCTCTHSTVPVACLTCDTIQPSSASGLPCSTCCPLRFSVSSREEKTAVLLDSLHQWSPYILDDAPSSLLGCCPCPGRLQKRSPESCLLSALLLSNSARSRALKHQLTIAEPSHCASEPSQLPPPGANHHERGGQCCCRVLSEDGRDSSAEHCHASSWQKPQQSSLQQVQRSLVHQHASQRTGLQMHRVSALAMVYNFACFSTFLLLKLKRLINEMLS